jgi:hypothetical protein
VTGVTTATNRCLDQINTLSGLLSQTTAFQPFYRKIIAELITVRLAVALENCLSGSFYRLASGTSFESGRAPTLHTRAGSIASAQSLLLSGGGFNWLNGSDLCTALQLPFDPSDPCLNNIRKHSTTLAEIRKIRNHIAHRNRTSGLAFRQVVRRVYGKELNGVTPGTLLLTSRHARRSLCEALLVGSRVMVRDIFEK